MKTRQQRRAEKKPQQDDDDIGGLLGGDDKPTGNPALAAVAARFGAFRPARQVLTRVKAVPTRFVQLDCATRVHGFPIERLAVVHGPSNNGKTEFCLGLIDSFLQGGHFGSLVDAEMTTPVTWLEAIMARHVDNPAFSALRPHSYEQTVDSVRDMFNAVLAAKKDGSIPSTTSALVVVDSIRKLVPEKLFEKIAKGSEGAGGKADKRKGVDGMGGRAGQMKAALNAAWVDELIPLLYHSGTAMVIITRESENDEATNRWDDDFKVTGGKALIFDSSLLMRVVRSSWVRESKAKRDDNTASPVVGERHKVTIKKTKVAGKDDKEVEFYFHTSNGVMFPAGFDRPRDVLELGVELKVIQQAGAWYSWGGKRWQGENTALRALHKDADLLARLEKDVRAKFPNEETTDRE